MNHPTPLNGKGPTPLLRLLALAGFGALLSAPALAQDSGHFYGGFGAGQARYHSDVDRISGSALGIGTTAGPTTSDRKDRAYKLFGGYQMSRHFGLELGYFDLGSFNYTADTTPAGTLAGQLRVKGANLDLVGTLPLTENLSAQARVGAQYARTRASYTTTGAATTPNPNPSARNTDVKLGLGLQYAFGSAFLVRGEAERYRVSDALGGKDHVDVLGVSLVFPFGHNAPAPQRVVAAPVVMAAAPPAPEPVPAPVVAPAPVADPVVLKRVSYSAESLFSFDHADIQAPGKAALDTFAGELQGAQFERVMVEGHTDRLGSEAYNQTLSQQRADTVKAYLVTVGKVDPGKISALGKGESAPVTKPGDCKGSGQSAPLIKCLQPDRRVDIEVSGTR